MEQGFRGKTQSDVFNMGFRAQSGAFLWIGRKRNKKTFDYRLVRDISLNFQIDLYKPI